MRSVGKFGEIIEGSLVDSLHHPVVGDIRIDDTRDGNVIELTGKFDGRCFGDIEPTFGGHATIPCVESQQKSPGSLFGGGAKPLGVLECRRSNDNPIDQNIVERLVESNIVADSSTQLAGDGDFRSDPAHDGSIYDSPGFRSVEIHQMQTARTGFDPAPGHGEGIVAKNCFGCVVSLAKSNALAAAEVDGGDDLDHG